MDQERIDKHHGLAADDISSGINRKNATGKAAAARTLIGQTVMLSINRILFSARSAADFSASQYINERNTCGCRQLPALK